ncbi:Somatomedin-B and thrombospondin type-1 domain-containing protein [Labeo rohita]|uniref:Somatomedin-B and thrombospondin type-1 domain-containing protein n=1 Tax=Labeo rohita TaxID=84645 RepID=A0ABQ8MYG8_LABRO|nr:Somatomedin-B and thrombospondin type-1 domain-containing protein [Labeo rohita]
MCTLSWTKMKVSDARSWLLLLFLVQTDRNQVSAQCSVPTVLCCAGKNSQCKRGGCFCDEYCVTKTDCCDDYNQTCIQSSLASSTSPSAATSSSTSPPSSSSLSTTNQSSSSPTSEPPSSSSPPPISASSSTPQQRKNSAILVFHMHVRSGANEEAKLKAMQDFVLHLEGLMRRQQCQDCSLRVLNISEKHH